MLILIWNSTIGNICSSSSSSRPYFQNRTTAFRMCAALNCGEPVPFIDGPMRFHYKVRMMWKSKWQCRPSNSSSRCVQLISNHHTIIFSAATNENTYYRFLRNRKLHENQKKSQHVDIGCGQRSSKSETTTRVVIGGRLRCFRFDGRLL